MLYDVHIAIDERETGFAEMFHNLSIKDYDDNDEEIVLAKGVGVVIPPEDANWPLEEFYSRRDYCDSLDGDVFESYMALENEGLDVPGGILFFHNIDVYSEKGLDAIANHIEDIIEYYPKKADIGLVCIIFDREKEFQKVEYLSHQEGWKIISLGEKACIVVREVGDFDA